MKYNPKCSRCQGSGYYWKTVKATVAGKRYTQNLWCNCERCNPFRQAKPKRGSR